jgi:hypothetical protein
MTYDEANDKRVYNLELRFDHLQSLVAQLTARIQELESTKSEQQ